MTAIDTTLLNKYEKTEYRVHAKSGSFVLALGRPSAELAALYRERRAASAAFITAFNPYSQPATEKQNLEANARLAEEMEGLGLDVLEAVGSDHAGNWQEASFLVLGILREHAQALGRAFRQNAVVYAGANAVPELVLLR